MEPSKKRINAGRQLLELRPRWQIPDPDKAVACLNQNEMVHVRLRIKWWLLWLKTVVHAAAAVVTTVTETTTKPPLFNNYAAITRWIHEYIPVTCSKCNSCAQMMRISVFTINCYFWHHHRNRCSMWLASRRQIWWWQESGYLPACPIACLSPPRVVRGWTVALKSN